MKIFNRNWLYILMIGLLLGLLITSMQWGQYHWITGRRSYEFYGVLVAVVFTGIGIWAASQFINRKTKVVEKLVEVEKTILIESKPEFDRQKFMDMTGISDRELEVLELLVRGASNQEIADKLFLSLSTVKTHVSNIFIKLEVSRRTQAVQKARSWGMV